MEKHKLSTLLKNNEKLEDFHLCEICKDIMLSPVTCKNCESNFCSECSKNYVPQNNGLCPNKCKFEESRPSKLVFKALDLLQFKCPYEECNEVLNYSAFFGHVKECMFINVQCDFCKKNFTKGNLQAHLSECEEFEMSCEICEIKMAKKQFLMHDTISCLKKYAIESKKEKKVIWDLVKQLCTDFDQLRLEMLKKEDVNRLLEKEILKKDEQNQEIRSRLENLEKSFSDFLKQKEENKALVIPHININDKNFLKEKIVVGWDPLLSRQGRCIIDVNDNKRLKIDSESCWNHFVVNKLFTNENFEVSVELKVVQEQNYVYFGVINENYSNSNNCMCQSPKNSFYIRCNGDISIDSTKFERKELSWGTNQVILTIRALLKEKQIYFSVGNKEGSGPYVLSGNTFRVVAGTCNKAKGEVYVMSCYAI